MKKCAKIMALSLVQRHFLAKLLYILYSFGQIDIQIDRLIKRQIKDRQIERKKERQIERKKERKKERNID